ncbi:MAG TPA: NAD(P)-dependent alcohol dehydrogenase, partial [Paenibacillus sp.]|nr:NAD(P)-dependent alcohol dehydrogenase [Paenibacillus sp.]
VGGRISLVGGLSGFQVAGFEIIPAILRKARLQAINVGSRDMFETMNLAIKQNGLRPIIDAVFPFEHSVEALQYLAKGTHFGKICIKF